MVASTRSTPETAYEHVLKVLGNDIFRKAFEEAGITQIYEFLTITPEDLREISFVEDGNMQKLSMVQIRKVTWIQKWFYANHESGSTSLNKWFDLSDSILNNFIMHGGITSETTSSSQKAVSKKEEPDLLPGVKRDITAYPVLREDKYWMNFNRTLLSMAATHTVKEVLDPSYVPTPEKQTTFNAKNTFMYSVFTRSLITAKAKVFLRAHEASQDAQGVYRDLVKAYSDGTAANLSAEALEQQLRSMKLDKSWNKKVETFLHTWSSRMHDLESIRDETVSEGDKRRWLTNSIKHHDALYQGINTAKSVENAMNGMSGYSGMTWEKFFSIILDHALILDSNEAKKSNCSAKTSNGKTKSHNKDWLPPEEWKKLTSSQKKEFLNKRKKGKRGL